MKQVPTTRFGNVSYSQDHLVRFPEGMIGFVRFKDYILIESSQMPLMFWLQSIDHPEIAFPLMEPWFFKRDYVAQVSEADKLSLALDDGNKLKTFVVMTIPDEMSRMTVNLKAPILINIDKALGVQGIQQEKSFEVRVPAHEAFHMALANLTHGSTSSDAPVAETFQVVDVKRVIKTQDSV